MENEATIVRSTLTDGEARNIRRQTQTDWARLAAMTDEELEASIDWEEEGQYNWGEPYPFRYPAIMTAATVCLDQSIVAWFTARGDDYVERIRLALRKYADSEIRKRAYERLPLYR